MPDDRTTVPLAACVVALLAILVFLPAARHPFTMYDDPVYVTENP